MKFQQLRIWALSAAVSLAPCLLASTAVLATQTTDADSAPLRALSLRVLQQRLQDCQSGKQCPEELLQLGGITRLTGYVVDRDNRDLLLLGTVEAGLPPMHVDDLVVAMRSAWQRYAKQRGNTLYLTAPGCSIDPDPKVVRKLQRIGDKVLNASEFGKGNNSGEQQWRKTCELPQKVRLLGVPQSRFAGVMVTADHDLKRIVDGVTRVPVDGLVSVTDLVLADIQEQIRKGGAVSSGMSMNRFWFTAGEVRFAEDDGIVVIDQIPVELRTEAEFVHSNGAVSGSGGTDPVADRFTQAFTERYAKVAAIKPIYTELENLYRFVGLMQAIKFRGAHAAADLDLDFLLDGYRLASVEVASSLPGRANVARFSHREEQSDGYRELKLLMPSCGGVEIDISLTDREFVSALPAVWREARVAARRARPSVTALYWDFDVPG